MRWKFITTGLFYSLTIWILPYLMAADLVLFAPTIGNSSFTFNFNSTEGSSYLLEKKTALDALPWEVAQSITATSSTTKITRPLSSELGAFFRVSPDTRVLPGAITDVQIQPNGWQAFVYISAMKTNGSFSSGLGTNQTLTGEEKFTLNISGSGFDDRGEVIPLKRTVYGKEIVRLPYSQQLYKDTVYDAVSNKVRFVISLTEHIYQNESVTAAIKAGLYANGTTNSLPANIAVSNNSTSTYPQPYARWMMAPLTEQTNNTAVLRLFAIGVGANGGRPVRAIHAWVTDEHGNTSLTNVITEATFVPSVACGVPLGIGSSQYVCNADISQLRVGDVLTCHAKVFAWMGDTNSVLSSDAGPNFPDERFCNWPLFNNKDGSWGTTVAHVNPVTGSDQSGRAADESNYQSAFDRPFATVAGAATAISRTNWLLHGRSDVELAKVYLTNGNYVWTGFPSPTITNDTGRTYIRVLPAPGISREQVVFTNANGNKRLTSAVHLSDCTISFAAGGSFSGANHMFIENCVFTNVVAAAAIDSVTNVWFFRNRVPALPQGLYTSGKANSAWRMICENDLSDLVGSAWPACFVGNYRGSGTNGALKVSWPSASLNSTIPPPGYPLVAFNSLLCEYSAVGGHILQIEKAPNGAAVVQNIVEQISSDPANATRVASICSSTSISADTNPCYNIYIVNNTFVGNRSNFAEGAGYSNGVANLPRSMVFVWNTLGDNLSCKDDIDYTRNGSKTNAWEVMYCVEWSGDVDLEPTDMDSAWHWGPALTRNQSTNHFALNSFFSGGFTEHGTNANWYLYPRFKNPQRGTSDTINGMTPGGGDYRVLSDSPLLPPRLPTKWVLPFDIRGFARSLADPPGSEAMVLPAGQ